MITAEELIQSIGSKEENKNFRLATVESLFENNTAKIQFDGEEQPSEKQYAYLESYTPVAGDKVLLGVLCGTYIILGKVNYNVSPTPVEEEVDRYLFDLRRVLIEKGIGITGGAEIEGDLLVEGEVVSEKVSSGEVSSTTDIRAGRNLSAMNMVSSYESFTSFASVGERIYMNGVSGKISSESVETKILAHTGTHLRFFNKPSAVAKKTINNLSTSTNVDIQSKVNELLNGLRDYGLIG